MDPYILIENKAMELKWKSKIDKNGSVKPKWKDQVLMIPVHDVDEKLDLSLWDDDNKGDVFICHSVLPISTWMKFRGETGVKLEREGKPAGVLQC